MLKENQLIEISWTQTAQHYFNGIGYTLNKGDTIYVKPEELPSGSHRRVKIICDCCGKDLEMEYRQYINKRIKFGGNYYCSKCGSGAIETKRKRRATCLEKYGVSNPMQNSLIASKCALSLNNGDGVPTSKQQQIIYELLLQKYPNTNLNYLEGSFSLDCMCVIDSQPLDIEYDGWYWHQDPQKDIKRDKILQNKGYKVLRIKSGKLTPTSEQLFESINLLLKSQHKYAELILSDYEKEEITN